MKWNGDVPAPAPALRCHTGTLAHNNKKASKQTHHSGSSWRVFFPQLGPMAWGLDHFLARVWGFRPAPLPWPYRGPTVDSTSTSTVVLQRGPLEKVLLSVCCIARHAACCAYELEVYTNGSRPPLRPAAAAAVISCLNSYY